MRILQIEGAVLDDRWLEYERQLLPSDVDVVRGKALVDLEKFKVGSIEVATHAITHHLHGTIDSMVEAEKQGYDAVVVDCFADPGIEYARELVRIPVLGPLNVGLHVAGMIGHKTCVLLPDFRRYLKEIGAKVIQYGFQDRAVLRGTGRPVSESFRDWELYRSTGEIGPFLTDMIDIAARSIEEDGADVIVLGSAGIKWIEEGLQKELAKRGYKITVINPQRVAVEFARALVTLKLSHSEVGYPPPRVRT